jgi:hypothetical protein
MKFYMIKFRIIFKYRELFYNKLIHNSVNEVGTICLNVRTHILKLSSDLSSYEVEFGPPESPALQTILRHTACVTAIVFHRWLSERRTSHPMKLSSLGQIGLHFRDICSEFHSLLHVSSSATCLIARALIL